MNHEAADHFAELLLETHFAFQVFLRLAMRSASGGKVEEVDL